MKNLYLFACWCTINNLFATDYYFSSSTGNNNTTINSQSTPWATLDKLNMTSLSSGDRVFFRAGDTFRGQITVTQSNITFDSYGSGTKPIISGAEQVTGWNLVSGKYEATVTKTVKNFFVNHYEMTLARFPNNGSYRYLDTPNGRFGFSDTELTEGSGYWNNAKICVRTSQWSWEKTTVSGYTPGQITYGTPTSLTAIAGFGYFFYDKFELLDTDQEWYYEASAQKIYYIGSDPNVANCEVSVQDWVAGILINSNASNITIQNLAFHKQYQAGVWISGNSSTGIVVNNCEFYGQYNHGIQANGRNHEINNCFFRAVDGHGVDVSNGGNVTIHHSTFRRIGQFRNSGIGGQTNFSAIALNFVDNCAVHHNNIDSTGYCGISADGNYITVEKNIVKHAMLLLNDGAPLKTFGGQSHHVTFRNNFASESNGNTEGMGNYANVFNTPGIYLDFDSNYITVEDNTIFDQTPKRLFLNGGTNNNTVQRNVVYGTNFLIDLNGASRPTAIHDDVIQNNVFFALSSSAVIMRQTESASSPGFNFGTIDYNYYFHPYNANRIALRMISGSPSYYTLYSWQSSTANDTHTIGSPYSWTSGQNESELKMNQTDDVVTVQLGNGTTKYYDLNGNALCGSITLHPYTSKIVIRTTEACNLPVELIFFNAHARDNGVELSWSTQSEKDTQYFLIERSRDLKTWQTIAQIDGYGTTSQRHDYQLLDQNPLFGTNYYRLWEYATDGQKTLGRIRAVTIEPTTQLFPNPAENRLTIACQKEFESSGTIQILDILGREIKRISLASFSSSQAEIDIQSLASGLYLVQISSATFQKTLRFRKL